MVPRYTLPGITDNFSDTKKYGRWFDIEAVVVEAMEELGLCPVGTADEIRKTAKIKPERIAEIEAETGHDVQSFVDQVRETLRLDIRKFFHKDLTSTDITENAFVLTVLEALVVVMVLTLELAEAVKKQALKYEFLQMMGRTHTQHAEPTTLGLYFTTWYDSLIRAQKRLQSAYKQMAFGKIRGAVGAYGPSLNPEIEERALSKLKPRITPVTTCLQIILRDRLASVMCELAILAADLENMAVNIRLAAQTEVMELQEPFGKARKASSKMPHKKNTDRTENVTGLARIVRAYASVALEDVVTWRERDISHSGPERIIVEDSFQLVCFMLKRMKGIVSELQVHGDRFQQNLDLTLGVSASPEVKGLLMEAGVEPDEAYRIAQDTAFEALREKKSYLSVLLASDRVPAEFKSKKIPQLFDNRRYLLHVDKIFERVFGKEQG